MPGAGSNRINEFGFYTNYYTLPEFIRNVVRIRIVRADPWRENAKKHDDAEEDRRSHRRAVMQKSFEHVTPPL